MSVRNAPHHGGMPMAPKREFKQGIDILQPKAEQQSRGDSQAKATVDIVAVPGLGANPWDCWESPKNKFNWLSSDEGLIRSCPSARILLYTYVSKWYGDRAVDQNIENLARTLLSALLTHRQGFEKRPIVFIGHSMGGLVVAKAVNLAAENREAYPWLFEVIVSCVFFGTPFSGAPVASAAVLYAEVTQRYALAVKSHLLDLMRPDSDQLREIRRDFTRNVAKGKYKIDVLCFFEVNPTTWSTLSANEIKFLDRFFDCAVPKTYRNMVTQDSATLDASNNLGLARAHRNMVKFEGPKDPSDYEYRTVMGELSRIVANAKVSVKKRLDSVRDVDPAQMRDLKKTLDTGTDPHKKRKDASQGITTTSWITDESEYKEWLGDDYKQWTSRERIQNQCLWVCGPEGKGKTSASIDTTKSIERLIEIMSDDRSYQGSSVVQAFYFCDATTEGSSPEALLKSLLWQLIEGQETLATYALRFVPRSTSDTTRRQAMQMSIENLWQCLQDMLEDEYLETVYVVINNLHMLPESDSATQKLLTYIAEEFAHNPQRKAKCRWLITSRSRHNVETVFTRQQSEIRTADTEMQGVEKPSQDLQLKLCVLKMDLESDKYQDQLGLNLRQHALTRVTELGKDRKYDMALSYFASATLGERADNTIWIDVAVLRLGSLPTQSNTVQVRKVLVDEVPQELDTLLDRMWAAIFASVADKDKLREMLRALILTFEDPSSAELSMLTELAYTGDQEDDLHKLVRACHPLLKIVDDCGVEKVQFALREVRSHLERRYERLLGFSKREMRWQHGYLAMRCFMHVCTSLQDKPKEDSGDGEDHFPENQNAVGDADDNRTTTSEPADQEDAETTIEEDYDVLGYAVKHWLHHASRATPDIADTLSRETNFWGPKSTIRHRWLDKYNDLTGAWICLSLDDVTGLHVAASLGFARLVVALLKNGHQHDIDAVDQLDNTPLHLAAYFGRPNTVEELLRNGSKIDHGMENERETPLYMAAREGKTNVMEKLLNMKANINAIAETGPLINAAILSGDPKAVKLLIEKDANLDVEETDNYYPPLVLSALNSQPNMFRILLEAVKTPLPAKQYDDALVAAASAGRQEIFDMLIGPQYQHSKECYQEALDKAADSDNWHIAQRLVEICPPNLRPDCNNAFKIAASCLADRDEFVVLLWQYSNKDISASTLDESLYTAADNVKLSTVKLLMGYGASPNATGDVYGDTLTAAAFDGSVEIVEALIENGVNVNGPNGWALQAAASTNSERHMRIAELLLEHNANVNAMTNSEQLPQGSAIQAACEASWLDMVKFLLEKGADPNLGTGEFNTPLIAAAWKGERDMVDLLLQYNADVNMRGGPYKGTALTAGADSLPPAAIISLLDRGADVNALDQDEDTALTLAALSSHKENAKILIEHGADIMHLNRNGENAMMIAYRQEHPPKEDDDDDDTESGSDGENSEDGSDDGGGDRDEAGEVNESASVTAGGDSQAAAPKDEQSATAVDTDTLADAVQSMDLNQDAESQAAPGEQDATEVQGGDEQQTTNEDDADESGSTDEEDETCFTMMQSHIYNILRALRKAVAAGDPSAIQIMKEAGLQVQLTKSTGPEKQEQNGEVAVEGGDQGDKSGQTEQTNPNDARGSWMAGDDRERPRFEEPRRDTIQGTNIQSVNQDIRGNFDKIVDHQTGVAYRSNNYHDMYDQSDPAIHGERMVGNNEFVNNVTNESPAFNNGRVENKEIHFVTQKPVYTASFANNTTGIDNSSIRDSSWTHDYYRKRDSAGQIDDGRYNNREYGSNSGYVDSDSTGGHGGNIDYLNSTGYRHNDAYRSDTGYATNNGYGNSGAYVDNMTYGRGGYSAYNSSGYADTNNDNNNTTAPPLNAMYPGAEPNINTPGPTYPSANMNINNTTSAHAGANTNDSSTPVPYPSSEMNNSNPTPFNNPELNNSFTEESYAQGQAGGSWKGRFSRLSNTVQSQFPKRRPVGPDRQTFYEGT